MRRIPDEPAQSDGTVRAPDLNPLREQTSMDAQAILHELTHAEGLPRLALKAATSRVLCLGRLAERHCDARHDRFEVPGKESVRPRFSLTATSLGSRHVH
jgi:hypothetical protein